MRQNTKSQQERAEIEASERRQKREGGFSLMEIRDRGWAYIPNHMGGTAVMEWHVDRPLRDYEVRSVVPDGMFKLTIGKETALFDLEEFKRSERWV